MPSMFLYMHSAGSHNIFNGDKKLILGLIWTLIQKYQLRMGGKQVLAIMVKETTGENLYNNNPISL